LSSCTIGSFLRRAQLHEWVTWLGRKCDIHFTWMKQVGSPIMCLTCIQGVTGTNRCLSTVILCKFFVPFLGPLILIPGWCLVVEYNYFLLHIFSSPCLPILPFIQFQITWAVDTVLLSNTFWTVVDYLWPKETNIDFSISCIIREWVLLYVLHWGRKKMIIWMTALQDSYFVPVVLLFSNPPPPPQTLDNQPMLLVTSESCRYQHLHEQYRYMYEG
jgi:hypothetical protein